MTITIKLLQDFIVYNDDLTQSKRAILDSKIFYLESTGFLGNLKILGHNLFEFPILELKNKLYCFIDENSIITFSTKRDNLKHFSIITDTSNWAEKHYENLKDIKHAKEFYKEILKIFKNTGEDYFFINGLSNIFRAQGQENFKLIAGYDYKDLGTSSEIKTLNDLTKKIRLLTKFRSLDFIAERSKVKKEKIISIIGIKTDISLKDIENLVKFCYKFSSNTLDIKQD
ncbi:MAG: hypothetical protein LBQ13_01330 [Endomicrobium sp.]|jgi:hypothetical protein|nr:hypothetical protein [Endomicrobium sp.]